MENNYNEEFIAKKWLWMMDCCKIRGCSPTLGWEYAAQAWLEWFKHETGMTEREYLNDNAS